MKIGLALSGGGVRATVFHLGVLKRLAEAREHWPEIDVVSTVSGGSLCVALVFEKAGRTWPSADQFAKTVLPSAKHVLTTCNLEAMYKRRLLSPHWWMRGRAFLVANLLRKHWGGKGNLKDLPKSPRWEICATCYETGKSWRFTNDRMGDYLAGYVMNPNFPLAEVVAASAAVPGLIGPLKIKTSGYKWLKKKNFTDSLPTVNMEPIAAKVTLWDGGVYDNLGMEPLFDPHGRLLGVDFLVVSDASRPLGEELRRFQFGIPPYIPPFRLIDAATDQVRAVRLRSFAGFLGENAGSGVIFRMGNTVDDIFSKAGKPKPSGWVNKRALSRLDVDDAAGMKTTLRKLTDDEYDHLLQHGYEVADATLCAYGHTALKTS